MCATARRPWPSSPGWPRMPEADRVLGAASSPPPPAPALPGAAVFSHSRLLRACEAFVEPFATVASLWLLVWIFERELSSRWLVVSVLAFALAYPGRPQLRASPARVVSDTVLSWAWTCGLLLAMGYATGHLDDFSRDVVLHWLWLAPVSQLLSHWALRQSAPTIIRLQGPPLRAVVVGMNEQGGSLADRLSLAHYTGVELLGFFDDRTPDRIHGRNRHRMLGRIQEIAEYVKKHRVQLVYLSLPMASQPRIKQLLDALKDTTASVYFVPDMFVTDLIQGRTDSICGLPVISVCETPFRGPNALVKRSSDLVLATLILILVSPLMLAIALSVKLSSPGPVIFKQRRYGLGGEEIVVYKFRSMNVTEDGSQIKQA